MRRPAMAASSYDEIGNRWVLEVYTVTATFPREEMFGPTSQRRCSASSIPANVAAKCGRSGGELSRICRIAFGSVSEFEDHLILARDLEMIVLATFEQLSSRITEVKKMLTGFLDKLTTEG